MQKVIDKSTGLPAHVHKVPGLNDITITECWSEVAIDGVIYYEDLPRIVNILNGIISRNKDICYP